jgi:hypothetical protein
MQHTYKAREMHEHKIHRRRKVNWPRQLAHLADSIKIHCVKRLIKSAFLRQSRLVCVCESEKEKEKEKEKDGGFPQHNTSTTSNNNKKKKREM